VKELLQLKSGSEVNGNLYATKLQIEPSANFNGQCHMTSSSSGVNSATKGQSNGAVEKNADKPVQYGLSA
jgi:cytoskeletal protein CcmA (bactofilin family)